jgi:hypothetical protein
MNHPPFRHPGAPRHARPVPGASSVEPLPAGPDLRSGGPRDAPPIATVFRDRVGTLRHARCGSAMALHGMRGEIEVDFYCLTCIAHVTLPRGVLDRIPIHLGRRDARHDPL